MRSMLRTLAAVLLLAAVLTPCLPARAALAQATVIKLATLVPEGSVWDKTLRDMGAEWSTSTQGRVSLRPVARSLAPHARKGNRSAGIVPEDYPHSTGSSTIGTFACFGTTTKPNTLNKCVPG